MTDSTQETPQAVYFLCDTSVRMTSARTVLADLAIGRLAAKISADPLLKMAVRWGVEHYDTDDGLVTMLPLQQVDFTDTVPAVRTTLAEPSFRAAADAMVSRMGSDISQLDVDFAEVRSPIVLVITSGCFVESPDDLDAALTRLLTTNLRGDTDRGWEPFVIFVAVQADAESPIAELLDAHAEIAGFTVDSEADLDVLDDVVIKAIRRSVVTGAGHVRYARGVIEEKDLTYGRVLASDATTEFVEVTRHPVRTIAGPAVYRRFLDVHEDADTHRLDDLLDLLDLRNVIADRALWPAKVVVADDPRVAAGLLSPARPPSYVDFGRLGVDTEDAVARMRICAALADTVDLAHRSGIALGARTCESAAYRMANERATVLLTECGDARRGAPATDDLTWLGRAIERCVAGPDDPDGVLDDAGRKLLIRLKSNATSAIPTGAQWRDHLTRRAVELQGPPQVEWVQVQPRFAPVGERVTVRWRTRYADSIRLMGADGIETPVAARSAHEGHAEVTVTEAGPITVCLTNQMGERRQDTQWVHVFELPRIREMPRPVVPSTAFDRTGGEFGDLISRTWVGSRPPVPRLDSPPVADRRPALPTPFPFDVSRWFSTRPAPTRSRFTKFWRWPWT